MNDFAISMWTKFDNNSNHEGVLSLYNTDGISDINKNMFIYKKFVNSENRRFLITWEKISVSVLNLQPIGITLHL